MDTQTNRNFHSTNQNFHYAIHFTKLLLIPSGLWPLRYPQKLLRPILMALSIFVILFMLIPVCLYICLIVRDVKIRLKSIGPLSFCLISLLKYVIVISKQGQITDCFAEIADDWTRVRESEERKMMLDSARTGRVLTVVCSLLMYSGAIPYLIVLPVAQGSMIVGNDTYRFLPYPSHFIFFNPYIRPIYDLIFLLQILCGFTIYTITCGVYSIAILCVMHICSQTAIASMMVHKLADGFDDRILGNVVKKHLHCLKFAAKLENTFMEIGFVEIVFSTFIICLLGYYLITEYEQRDMLATITYFLILLSFVFNIFMLCYVGQILTENCESVGTAAYMMNWYKLPGKQARLLIFLILWQQRQVKLTGGKILTLSLRTFTGIIKMAAGYLNILRTAVANAN